MVKKYEDDLLNYESNIKERKQKILENKENKEALDKVIKYLCNKFQYIFDEEYIYDILNKNNFGSFYIIEDADWDEFIRISFEITDKEFPILVRGFFDQKNIYVKKSEFEKNITLGTHELIHVILKNNITKNMIDIFSNIDETYEGSPFEFKGIGIEEGLVSLVYLLKEDGSIDYSKFDEKGSYPSNVKMLLQLNELYLSYSQKKYDNILVEAILDSKNFLNLIYKMYYEFIVNCYKKSNHLSKNDNISEKENFVLENIALKSAYVILCYLDNRINAIKRKEELIKEYVLYAYKINAIFYYMTDDNLFNDKIDSKYNLINSITTIKNIKEEYNYEILINGLFGGKIKNQEQFKAEFLLEELDSIYSEFIVRTDEISEIKEEDRKK